MNLIIDSRNQSRMEEYVKQGEMTPELLAAVGFFFFTSLSARQECRAELILTSKLLHAVIGRCL